MIVDTKRESNKTRRILDNYYKHNKFNWTQIVIGGHEDHFVGERWICK
jgi:hypothetical protein